MDIGDCIWHTGGVEKEDHGDCIGIQEELRKRIILRDEFPREIKTVAGVDHSFPGNYPIGYW